jgi:predicted ATPase
MPAPASTLPAASTPFFGREHEMARLAHLLRDPTVRLVTILGPGGMGKTRFAVEAARRLAEGSAEFAATAATASPELDVTLVELASLAGPEFVLPAIAEALGFRFYPGGDPKAQLLAYLRRRRLLLLLDNFEHVLGAGTLVSDILEAAPGARALVTSRERLNLSGESVLALTGMAYPEAGARERSSDFSSVRLFLASARRVNSELEVDEENERAAARICRAVQGLPLGIVLAASWSSTLSLREIADEVARSFAFLSAEVRDVPARQHSLRAVFEYSFELLEPEERVVFARLAVFRGGFTRAAAERVAGATLKTLAALVNKSLITREPKTGRYWVHELLRQYAESQCQSSPTEYEQVRDRHASHFVELLERLTPDLRGVAPDVAAAAIDTELDNVRATWTHLLERQDLAGISKALEALALFYRLRSAFIEADSAFGAAVTRLAQPMPERGSASSRVLARSLGLKAHAAMSLWRNAEALEVAAQALALLDETAEPLLSGQALLVWAVASLWEGRVEQGLEAADRAASLYRRAGEAWETAQALLLLGRCRDWLGRAKAEALVREAIALQRSLPGGQVSGASLHDLGDVMAERGNYAEGCRLMREGLALVEDHGSLFDRHLCLLHLASAERKCGEYEAAEEHARGSVRLAREAFPFAETWALGVLGDVLKDRGRVDEATHCYQACLASGETLPRALALVNLGALALQRGEPEAEAMLLQGLGEFERHGTAWGIVAACDYLGHSACSSGRIETARAYFRRGLRQAVSEDLMPLAFNHLIGFARATALDGNLERAVELLSLVEQNAISERSALDNELKPLLAELSARLPTAHFGAAMARGQTLELAATLRELSA